QVEQARRGRFEQAFLEQPDRHIGRKEQIVELEPGAERKKRDQPAHMPRRRQAIEPRGNGDDSRIRGRVGSHACPPRSGPTCARTFSNVLQRCLAAKTVTARGATQSGFWRGPPRSSDQSWIGGQGGGG